MQLEDYLDLNDPDAIRIKGHRIWIQHILYPYIYGSRTAEEIQRDYYPSLSLDQVYTVILYYLRNKEAMTRYLTDWLEFCRTSREEARRKDPEFYERMRQRKVDWLARQKQQAGV